MPGSRMRRKNRNPKVPRAQRARVDVQREVLRELPDPRPRDRREPAIEPGTCIEQGDDMGSKSENGSGSGAGSGGSSGGSETGAEAGSAADTGAGTAAGTETAQSAHGVAAGGPGLVGHASLAAEAEAALAGAGIDAGTAGAMVAPDAGWKQITPGVVDVACIVVLPQWKIEKDERGLVSESLSECLEQVFPGGLDGKYACWIKLIFAVGGIAAARAMQPGGMPPLFQNKPKARSAPAPAARDPDTLTSLTPDA